MTSADALGVVLSGGGARGAYQAGVLRSISKRHPNLQPEVLTGVSAGAISACDLACHTGDWRERVEGLVDVWLGLRVTSVIEVHAAALALNVLRWGSRLVVGRASSRIRTRGLVDTAPLRRLLEDRMRPQNGQLPGIDRNLAEGRLRALAITAASYSTGQSVSWVQGTHYEPWERAQRKSVAVKIGVEHVMASSALPLFFPAVRVADQWYGDGGMRMSAPFSPAIHLGATRILAISTRYRRSQLEADRPVIDDYPPPAQVLGALYNSIFLDQFDADALQLERINRLVRMAPDAGSEGLRPIELLVLRPSLDLGKLANQFEVKLPKAFRFLTRGLGTAETRSNDALSLMMFQTDYLNALVRLGEQDANARAAEIDAFLRPHATA